MDNARVSCIVEDRGEERKEDMTRLGMVCAQCALNDLARAVRLLAEWRRANPCLAVRESGYAYALIIEALQALERKALFNPTPDDEKDRTLLLRLLNETPEPEGPPRNKRALLF